MDAHGVSLGALKAPWVLNARTEVPGGVPGGHREVCSQGSVLGAALPPLLLGGDAASAAHGDLVRDGDSCCVLCHCSKQQDGNVKRCHSNCWK
mmetsp:Transcript_18161/g.38372  ORF Transcript_18161/g.38372 Transcript_18161/m.38372 type:complete len:93 (+) Transcript_18161:710-988(+)